VKNRWYAPILLSLVLAGCGSSEPQGREIPPDCKYFEQAYDSYWSQRQDSNEPLPQWVERDAQEVTTEVLAREWPLVRDETLRYLMKSMAEVKLLSFPDGATLIPGVGARQLAQERHWRQNFAGAMSYCNMPDPSSD
jgi:hypothetical protein